MRNPAAILLIAAAAWFLDRCLASLGSTPGDSLSGASIFFASACVVSLAGLAWILAASQRADAAWWRRRSRSGRSPGETSDR